MRSLARTVSLVAEKAVRHLHRHGPTADSRTLARALLSTRIANEDAATRLLAGAIGEDARLEYVDGAWRLADAEPLTDPTHDGARGDRTLLLLDGGRPAGARDWILRHVVAVRFEGETLVGACGGEPVRGASGNDLRSAILECLEGAVPVVHDPPGSLRALERWLEAPVGTPVSLRRLGQRRCGLPARHDIEQLAARLELDYRETSDPLDVADVVDRCLSKLMREGESLEDLQRAAQPDGPVFDWSRLAFDRAFLRGLPHTPGTYRFFDREGRLLYVGKSKNLNRRIGSYFRQEAKRSRRQLEMLRALYRIEVQPTGSDLEAVIEEARQIRERAPQANVKKRVKPGKVGGDRLASILILEPATPPLVLRAYLIRDGRLLDRVGIGPRGGGLRRIERVMEDRFFGVVDGPLPVAGPDLDVELIARWLAEHRDRVVAFDPTDLASAREVTDRLRWFLAQGGPFDGDGAPIHSR